MHRKKTVQIFLYSALIKKKSQRLIDRTKEDLRNLNIIILLI